MKTKKKILIVIGIIILMILLYMFWTEWRFERVRVTGSKAQYIEEYEDYCHKVVFKPNPMPAPFGSSAYIIYFSFGQKKKMLDKIKEDVTNELEMLLEKYSDMFYKYEISDDFKKIYIYKSSNKYRLSEITSGRISSLIGLYHNVKKGRTMEMNVSDDVDFAKYEVLG